MSDRPLNAADFFAQCVCLGVNRAARVVSRRYDAALRPSGLSSGQFSILGSLARDEAVALGVLADLLGMDRTTLNRNLKPLEAEGMVATGVDPNDRRIRSVRLTQAGRDRLQQAVPLWEKAQDQSTRRIEQGGWPPIRASLDNLGR
jgi:DNA-binding MarR family transcriptional regulator